MNKSKEFHYHYACELGKNIIEYQLKMEMCVNANKTYK